MIERHIKGGQKTIVFLGLLFRRTSDVNISKTVYPIYFKIKVQRVPTSHSSYINFQVNRINRLRDIDVGRNQLGLSMDIETKVVQHGSSSKESNLTTINLTHLFHL